MGDGRDTTPFADVYARSREDGLDDPYSGVDISALPAWWGRAIEEHKSCGLRPYVPPAFEDGVPKFAVVDELESAYGVTIDFVRLSLDEPWQIRVDDVPVSTVERRREPGGASTVLLTSDEFRALVSEHVDDH